MIFKIKHLDRTFMENAELDLIKDTMLKKELEEPIPDNLTDICNQLSIERMGKQ